MSQTEFDILQSESMKTHLQRFLQEGTIYNSLDDEILISEKIQPSMKQKYSIASDEKTANTYILSEKEINLIKNLRSNLSRSVATSDQDQVYRHLIKNIGILTSKAGSIGKSEAYDLMSQEPITKDEDQSTKKRVMKDFNITDSHFFTKKNLVGNTKLNKYSIDQSVKIDQEFELGMVPKHPSFAGTSTEILKKSKTALGSQRNLTFNERKP